MKSKFLSLCVLFLVGLFLAAVLWGSGARQAAANDGRIAGLAYTVTDLGVFPGGNYSRAYGINDLGEVVGTADVPEVFTSQAFLWLPEAAYGLPAGLNNLGTMGGSYSIAQAINNSGQITGRADRELGGHAFLWENGTMLDLGDLSDGEGDSLGNGINEAGQVVGETETEGWIQAFLWDGAMATIDDEARDSEATDINEAGHIVGLWKNEEGADRAFYLADGIRTDLGMLDGSHAPSGGAGSRAYALNDANQIVGSSHNVEGTFASAFIYLFEPAYGLPAGMNAIADDGSTAYGINNHGQVVGATPTDSGLNYAAFLWECGQTLNLNELIDPATGWALRLAYDINDNGQIVGEGIVNGEIHGFLLTPVPNDDTGMGRENGCVSFDHARYLPAVTNN